MPRTSAYQSQADSYRFPLLSCLKEISTGFIFQKGLGRNLFYFLAKKTDEKG